jgi:hypothetical protein
MVAMIRAIQLAESEQQLEMPLDPAGGITSYELGFGLLDRAPDWPPIFRLRMTDGAVFDVMVGKR